MRHLGILEFIVLDSILYCVFDRSSSGNELDDRGKSLTPADIDPSWSVPAWGVGAVRLLYL